MNCRTPSLLVFLSVMVALPMAAQGQPITISQAIAPPVEGPGTGLCMASTEASLDDLTRLTGNPNIYNSEINAFMEGATLVPERVLNRPLDLSNNIPNPIATDLGDFINTSVPLCPPGGCPFFGIVDDDKGSFFSRLRGFLNVTDDMVGREMRIGMFLDDSASLTIFDKNLNAFPIIILPPELGRPTWRVTQTVIFAESGLYAVEILYGAVGDGLRDTAVALEMASFFGEYPDQEVTPQADGGREFFEVGFELFPQTSFYQTLSGVPSFADVTQCQQCNRQFVNLPGNNDCPLGNYCNEAALCAPCDSGLFCGPTCSPCGGASPFCVNINEQYQCAECREDQDCPSGSVCVDGECLECDSDDSCAGNSCNCCPGGTSCTPLGEGGPVVCAACTGNGDCDNGQICDLQVGQCVDELYENQRPDCCGDGCLECPDDFPFCLPGPLGTACAECRWDTDCPSGNFCLSGQCEPCTRDRRCGLRCTTCEGETPYCLPGQNPTDSTCVRCTEDSQCDGGRCNLETNECEAEECAMSCLDGLQCYGTQCVECFADTQCPCNGTCDLETNTCDSQCKANVDCLGNEHCRWDIEGETKECALGPMLGDTSCGGTLADTCSIAVGHRERSRSGVVWILGLCALLLMRRRRRQGSDFASNRKQDRA